MRRESLIGTQFIFYVFNCLLSSRGYAFVEFEDERDAKTAYKQADGKKIDGRRVMVDVERGRRFFRGRFFRGSFG